MGVGAPRDPKVNFWILVGYLSGYWSGECLGPGNFGNWTCAVQEHASTTLDAIGSAAGFFALLRTTYAYNLTHVYYSFIRSGYRFVSVSMSSRHRHQQGPHMKGPFIHWDKSSSCSNT